MDGGTFGEEDDAALPTRIENPKSLVMDGLGIKAIQWIVRAADPLAMLRHVSQNLPTAAFALAATAVDQAALESARIHHHGANVAAGLVVMNGRGLGTADVNDLHPYTLLGSLRAELWTAETLVAAGLTPPQAATLVTESGTYSAHARPPLVLDVRTPAAVVFNDLRTDARYAQFAPRLAQIVHMPLQFYGQMLFLRQNLATALFVLDPADVEQMLVLVRIAQYLQRAVPLRFATLFLDADSGTRRALGAGSPTDVSRSQSLTATLYRAMTAARDHGGDQAVHKLLLEYGRQVQMTGRSDHELVHAAFLAARVGSWPASVIASDAITALDAWAEQAHADAGPRGMEPGSIYVNGEYLPWERVRQPGAKAARASRAPSR